LPIVCSFLAAKGNSPVFLGVVIESIKPAQGVQDRLRLTGGAEVLIEKATMIRVGPFAWATWLSMLQNSFSLHFLHLFPHWVVIAPVPPVRVQWPECV
jgi:hypothetical protein